MDFDHPSKDIIASKGNMLKGKTICVCLTGSVAVVNSVALCRELMRNGAEVYVVMTKNANSLIQPDLLHWATGNPVICELTGYTEHITLAGERPGKFGKADLVLIAPATANTISKIACGIDDTPVTTVATTAFGSGTPIIIVPAMHQSMYNHPILIKNIEYLQSLGVNIILPRIEENKAKIAEVSEIVSLVISKFNTKLDCENKNFLITAGPGREYIDHVRFISNPSSGKMGFELAKEIISRGGKVTLIYGKGSTAKLPAKSMNIEVDTCEEFLKNSLDRLDTENYDVFISAAAIPDYKPIQKIEGKLPSLQDKLTLEFVPTKKVIKEVRNVNNDIYIVAFKAESIQDSSELVKKAYKHMKNSQTNMIVANDISDSTKTGFQSDTNEVYIIKDISGSQNVEHISNTHKRLVSRKIVDSILNDL